MEETLRDGDGVPIDSKVQSLLEAISYGVETVPGAALLPQIDGDLERITHVRDALGRVQPRTVVPPLPFFVDKPPESDRTLTDEDAETLRGMVEGLLSVHTAVTSDTKGPFSHYMQAPVSESTHNRDLEVARLTRLQRKLNAAQEAGIAITRAYLSRSNSLHTAQAVAEHYRNALQAAREGLWGEHLNLFFDYPIVGEMEEAMSRDGRAAERTLTILHPEYREQSVTRLEQMSDYPFTLSSRLVATGDMRVSVDGKEKELDLAMIEETLAVYDQLSAARAVSPFTAIAAYNGAVLRKMLGDYYLRGGDTTAAFHYYTNALQGQKLAYDIYTLIKTNTTMWKWQTGNDALDASAYNGMTPDFAASEQVDVVREIADTLLRRTLLDKRDPDRMEHVEKDFVTVIALLGFVLEARPENAYLVHLYTYALFQFGEFYQDIVRDPEKAARLYTQILAHARGDGALADESGRRRDLLEGRIRVNTPEGVISRDIHIANLARITAAIHAGAAAFFDDDGGVWVDVPEVVGVTGACENVATLFQILFARLPNNPFFGTQTGQLALELIQQQLPNVWTRIKSLRAELPDERHLLDFPLTEQEFAWSQIPGAPKEYDQELMFEAVLDKIEQVTKAMMRAALQRHADILAQYGRDAARLLEVLDRPYLRITYTDAIDLLRQKGWDIAWGDDLQAKHEREILRLVNERSGVTDIDEYSPMFITEYPEKIKFFNMAVKRKDNDDPERKVVKSADLIVPYAGEAVGAAVREHEFDVLLRRLLDSNMYKRHTEAGGTLQQFQWYLDLIEQQRTEPHAGYGIGNSRLVQWLLRLSEIRDCSVEQLISEATGDWHDLSIATPPYPTTEPAVPTEEIAN